MKYRFQIFSGALLACCFSLSAETIRWDAGNGHLYEAVLVKDGINWVQAKAAAEARGLGWHLATIASAEENAFVYGLIAGKPEFFRPEYFNTGPWLGGYLTDEWRWVTGEPFSFTNWTPPEPFSNGDSISFFGFQPQGGAPNGWDDIRQTALVNGYIAENDQAAGTMICGEIGLSATEIWKADGSPYVVSCNLLVHDLVIAPGVEVQVAGDFVIEITGVMKAVGTKDNRIRLRGKNGEQWKGLLFRESEERCALEFCDITDSTMSGIRIDSSKPTIRNCRITGNSSVRSSCWMRHDPNVPYHGGGGIQSNSDLALENCEISDNQSLAPADTPGPCGIDNDHLLDGGAISTAGCLALTECSLERNTIVCTAGGAGGAIFAAGGLRMRNCIIRDNSIRIDGWVSRTVRGGGLAVVSGETYISNCLVAGNNTFAFAVVEAAHTEGCGVHLSGGGAEITNCTIVGNGGNNELVGVFSSKPLRLRNSIVFANMGAQIAGPITAEYCDIQGGFEGVGGIDLDPGFQPGSPLFELSANSPCIDAGDPNPIFSDCSKSAAKGNARNDMGYQGGPCERPDAPEFRRGDPNGSGRVDITDAISLLNFLFLGGRVPNCLDAGDFDDNGVIEITDPIAILGYSFLGKEPPRAPGPNSCGKDPTEDCLLVCQYSCN